MFIGNNYANFLANPYASLGELGDLEDFDNDVDADEEAEGDMHLEFAQ